MDQLSTTLEIKPEFSIRIVVCDHYMVKPTPGIDITYSEFRGSDIKQVPILRIFGSATDGQKTCLHIHGVFPYFYLPCPTSNPKPEFLYQIAASLDKALNIALKQATSTNQHVYKITLVKGLPFYGFHDKDHLYLKVFLYSPNLIKQAVELCSNGAILGQSLQPHESHLNFTLQFFIDFNLFGMSNIDLQNVIFRKSGISQPSNEIIESPNGFCLKSESVCYYEADCFASHIINRQRVGKSDGIENPGLEEVWNQEQERRKQLNISIGPKSLSQGRLKTEQTESHYKFEQMFLIKMSGMINKPVEVDASTKKSNLDVHYPAESIEGSQLLKAADVSVHSPFVNTGSQSYNLTLPVDSDSTIVDEDKALNSSLSLHYSQVLLDHEDLELVDMLQDMDEKVIEEDSVIATPAEDDHDSDDAEYSQVFNNETLVLDQCENTKDDGSHSWNDSFWDDVNIPQLDGTCDDDHVKKVRKRKMRAFKLGLSRPKAKKTNNKSSKSDNSDTDEINVSRETIHFNVPLKKTPDPESESYSDIAEVENVSESSKEESILDVVNRLSKKNKRSNPIASESYDLIQRFEPEPGPSRRNNDIKSMQHCENVSSPEGCDLGITSFYNTSRLFNQSSENVTTIVYNKTKNSTHEKVPENYSHSEFVTSKNNMLCFTPKVKPPLKTYIESTLHKYNIPEYRNQQPFYSDPKDVGDKVEIGHLLLKLQSHSAKHQKSFEKVLDTTSLEEWRHLMFLQDNEFTENSSKTENLRTLLAGNKLVVLKPLKNPPTTDQIKNSLNSKKEAPVSLKEDLDTKEITRIKDELENSQAIGLYEDKMNISLENQNLDKSSSDKSLQVTMQTDGSFLCFGVTNSLKETSSIDIPALEANFLTLMLIEVHTSVRGNLHPDPLVDPIHAVFINLTNDYPANHLLFKCTTEIVTVDSTSSKLLDRCTFNSHVTYVQSENDLFVKVIDLVKQHDPDILCGYEIEKGSWGYLFERSQALGLEIISDISRITDKNRQKRWKSDDNDLEGRIIGRIIFNVWRLLRHELALSSYSFENCMYEVLSERVPLYNYANLWKWWSDESSILRWIPVEYYLTRLSGTLRILEKLDIINRTSELARLFGLQWWEVLSRGSQFRVESLMLRAARPLNLIALSPTVKQRAAMRAPECLPLIFEPESRFYTDPMIVLDFQSLYPSMMIAYNYCFSTCIGRVQSINGDSDYEFGAWRLRVPKAKLEALVRNGHVHWSPVGVGFVKSSVRRGVLPALLRRILAARQAVKKSMKLQTDEAVKKAMHSRQLGLKLIANVTYGYTAANFSGRMPCIEVGDSVVAKGRETLERAIKLVQNNTQWNAKVVYGDTDSMFVLVPGGSRAQAFDIGQQIADAVTADNPSPVALKLEKVYQPCILQTKKRYVGYMYESADQEKPVYEAKGIETVRRDGCPAGVKLLQRSLVELFESGDMSRVKQLVLATLARLANDSLPPQELFFSREYHGPAGYRPGAAAPPYEIAKRISSEDPRAVPSRGWRVRWQVAAGAPGATLVRLARSPHELLRRPARAHRHYYAARVLLPPLHRCLSLLGVDVFKWLEEVRVSGGLDAAAGELARWVRARAAPPPAALVRRHRALAHLHAARQICESCCGHSQSIHCENTECPVLWKRIEEERRLFNIQDINTIDF